MTDVMNLDQALFSVLSKITGIIFVLFIDLAITALSALGNCHEMGPKENRSSSLSVFLSRARARFLSFFLPVPRFIVRFGY